MTASSPPNDYLPHGLAKARELLLLDQAHFMPSAAGEQRAEVMAALEAQITVYLAEHDAPVPACPEEGALSRRAWGYCSQALSRPPQESADTPPAYTRLKSLFDTRKNLFLVAEVLDWLQQCQGCFTPGLAIEAGAVEHASVAVEIAAQRLLDSPVVTTWADETAMHAVTLAADDQRNFALMQHSRLQTSALDASLVEDLKKATMASHIAWEAARAANRFADWLPHFETVFALTRRKGEALAAQFHISPYQALVDERNPELKLATIDRLFSELRARLPGLIAHVLDYQADRPAPLPLPEIAPARQKQVALRVMERLGLDPAHARLDESAHPFSTGYLDDVRITTRYRPHDMLSGLLAIIHETGHALYSQHLPRAWRNQPIGQDQSMWIHESQSLFWEMQIARSPAFMAYLAPVIREVLGVDGPEWSAENLYALSTRARRSMIRVEADEVTYPAHVILRYDLETRLTDGSLAPRDVPAAWAQAMRELLQTQVPDDARGCLQDVHWPEGLFGYFPAYTLGALAAAQLMARLSQDIPTLDELVRKGEFTAAREWLSEHIHRHGSAMDGEELILRATGKPLSTQAWFEHIGRRYLGVDGGT